MLFKKKKSGCEEVWGCWVGEKSSPVAALLPYTQVSGKVKDAGTQ